MQETLALGLIGGSGLYQLPMDITDTLTIETPFGPTSAPISIAHVQNHPVAFLPRHGKGHRLPPHRINYRANIWALASLGVRAVISSAAVGSISPEHRRDTFAVPHDFFDRTTGRVDTFYDGTEYGENLPGVQHLPAAMTYCPVLRETLLQSLADSGERYQNQAVLGIINGPRFATGTESAWLRSAGVDLLNMTQYPEAALAAELNLGYATLTYITDTDSTVEGNGHDGSEAVTADLVLTRLKAAQSRVIQVLGRFVEIFDADYSPAERISPEAVATVLAAPTTGELRTSSRKKSS